MARTKLVNGKKVNFTEKEEAERDAEEARWLAGAPEREAEEANRLYEEDLDMPSLKEKVDALLESGTKLDEVKARVSAVKIKHGRA